MSRLTYVFLFACLLFLLVHCSSIGRQNQQDDGYKIYSAAITKAFAGADNTRILSISNTVRSNDSTTRLERRFSLPFEYELVDGDRVLSDFEKLKSEELIQKYPNFAGLVVLYPIVFDAAHKEASVRIEYTLCPLCSFATTYHLQKDFTGWKVVSEDGGLVS